MLEYRGKQYSVQGIQPGEWKWSVELEEKTKSGKAVSRAVAVALAKREIDRTLMPKRIILKPSAI
jgi:hypothetical protein